MVLGVLGFSSSNNNNSNNNIIPSSNNNNNNNNKTRNKTRVGTAFLVRGRLIPHSRVMVGYSTPCYPYAHTCHAITAGKIKGHSL